MTTQRNAWIHALISSLVIVVAFWLSLPLRDWAVLMIAIALVWTAEFINTSLEAVVDLASPDQHPLAKVGIAARFAGSAHLYHRYRVTYSRPSLMDQVTAAPERPALENLKNLIK